MKKTLLSGCIGAALLAASLPAAAITNIETNATIPFSFSNPGARSLAMGGAFLGLADDATAAYTNPAGLTRLGISKQFSAEFRQLSFETPYAASGNFGIRPFDLSGVNYNKASDDANELAFIAAVLPQENWSLAFYRHQLLNYRNGYTNQQIFFPADFTFDDLSGYFTLPYTATADLSIESYGISFGHNLTDTLSWGIGIAHHRFEIDTFNERFNPLLNNAVIFRNVQSGSDNDISFNVGLLYRSSDRFSIGLSYRSAPSFDYQVRSTFVDTGEETANFTTRLKSPDSFGLGFSWRASDRLTLNLDVNHVGYSNLSRQVDDAFFSGDYANLSNPVLLRSFAVKDRIEPRVGMEYAFDTAHPFFLRAGAWRESQRSLKFIANPDDSLFANDPVEAYAEAVLFSAGEDVNHYSLGFGWAFSRFQLDFAYDHADTQDTFSLSGVLRWD